MVQKTVRKSREAEDSEDRRRDGGPVGYSVDSEDRLDVVTA